MSNTHHKSVSIFGPIEDVKRIRYLSSLATNFAMSAGSGSAASGVGSNEPDEDYDELAADLAQEESGLAGRSIGVQRMLGAWSHGGRNPLQLTPWFISEAFLAAGVVGFDHQTSGAAPKRPLPPAISAASRNPAQDLIDLLDGDVPSRNEGCYSGLAKGDYAEPGTSWAESKGAATQTRDVIVEVDPAQPLLGRLDLFLEPGRDTLSWTFFQQLSAAFPRCGVVITDNSERVYNYYAALCGGECVDSECIEVGDAKYFDVESLPDDAWQLVDNVWVPPETWQDPDGNVLTNIDTANVRVSARIDLAAVTASLAAIAAAGKVHGALSTLSTETEVAPSAASLRVTGEMLSRGPGEIFSGLDEMLISDGEIVVGNPADSFDNLMSGAHEVAAISRETCLRLLALCATDTDDGEEAVKVLSSPAATLANRTHFLAQVSQFLGASDYNACGAPLTPEARGFDLLAQRMQANLPMPADADPELSLELNEALRGHGRLLPSYSADPSSSGWAAAKFRAAIENLPDADRTRFTEIHLCLAMLTTPSMAAWELASRHGVDWEFVSESAIECPHRTQVLANAFGVNGLPDRVQGDRLAEFATGAAVPGTVAEVKSPTLVPGTVEAREAVAAAVDVLQRRAAMKASIEASSSSAAESVAPDSAPVRRRSRHI